MLLRKNRKTGQVLCLFLILIYLVYIFLICLWELGMQKAVHLERNEIAKKMHRVGMNQSSLEAGGRPLRSIVVTSDPAFDAISTIFNTTVPIYQHFEPFLLLSNKREVPSFLTQWELNNVRNALECQYRKIFPFMGLGRRQGIYLIENEQQRKLCKQYPLYCMHPHFLTEICALYSVHAMISTKLRLVASLLDDKSLNVRIVMLVRDPRGTMQSRKHRVWCAGNPDCDDPRYLCEDLVDDYKYSERLLKLYPSRFRTLRYEDLSLNPYDMTQEVLQFYGLPFDPMVEEFLDTHTKVNIGGVSSTYRDSKMAPFHWKQDLRIDEIKHIQERCTKAMELWGYRVISNFTDFQHATFDPIVMPPPLA